MDTYLCPLLQLLVPGNVESGGFTKTLALQEGAFHDAPGGKWHQPEGEGVAPREIDV